MSVKNKNRLRDFQVALAERLQQATRQPERRARLAVAFAGRQFLLSLDQVAEVVPVPTLVRVAKTQPWFSGVTNVRGTLYAVTDLSHWYAGQPTRLDSEARLVILGGTLAKARTAVLVSRVLGLRQLEELETMGKGVDGWTIARWKAPDGSEWMEVDLQRLLTEPGFLQIAA
ncbi:MAG: chemotaxis protein CheW [Casimicrobiaceae bacterium]